MDSPPELQKGVLSIVLAVVISAVSGFISIAQRIARGHSTSWLWILSEFAAAVLCGYLMYDAYPRLSLPQWATLPVMVALSAHMGGRALQEIESHVLTKLDSIRISVSGKSSKPDPEQESELTPQNPK